MNPPETIQALFAPDWREGVPYQRLLAEGLLAQGADISFLRDYKRGFPLSRLVRGRARQKRVDLLHLHWPEAYYPRKKDAWDLLRAARYSLDLTLARQGRALVITAHNLHTHNQGNAPFEQRNTRASMTQAHRIIAHSPAARDVIRSTFGLDEKKVAVIPHGDLSAAMGAPFDRKEARSALGLGAEKIVLMFGTVEPYKGIEELVDAWRRNLGAGTLTIVGKPLSSAYDTSIRAHIGDLKTVDYRPGWLSDDDLRRWISAADCAIMNYRTIFTSGAASLARSYGLPIVLPSRLKTIDLDEPSPYVRRFETVETDLKQQVEAALGTFPSFASAEQWRDLINWNRIATATLDVYREAISASK